MQLSAANALAKMVKFTHFTDKERINCSPMTPN